MQAHVQHNLAPTLVLAFLRAQPVDQLAQDGELRFGDVALLGLLLRQHLAQLQVELLHFRQAPVVQLDGQQGAAVEGHLLQAGVDFVQALADRLAGLGAVPLQRQQVVLALVLQQVEEAFFVLRQAIAFKAFEAGEEILGRGHRHGEVARFFRPLLDEATEAAQQQVLDAVDVLLRRRQLFVQRVADLAHVRFQRFQAERALLLQALGQAGFLVFGQCRQHQCTALLAGPVQAVAFAHQLTALDAGVFVSAAGLLDVGAGGVDLLGDPGQVGVAFAQGVQAGLDVGQALLRRGDVDFVPADADQLVAGQATFVVAVTLAAQARDVGIAAGDTGGQLLGFLLEDGEPVAVAEAQQPAAAIVHRTAVVLLEAVAGMLDLALAGDAALHVAQLPGIHALIVIALAKLATQPRLEHTVAELQLVQQRFRGRFAGERIVIATHAVVGEPHAQVGAVHPFGDVVVVLVVDQQRLREATEHTLDRALPALLFRADLDQFADERQGRFGDTGFFGQARAQLLHRRRNAGGRALHRLQFATHVGEAPLVVALAAQPFADGVVQGARSTLTVFQFGLRLLDQRGEAMRVVGQRGLQFLCGVVCLRLLGQAAVAFGFGAALLAFQFLDALTTLLAALQFQLSQAFGVVVQGRTALRFFTQQATIARVHLAQARFDQQLTAAFAEAVDAELERFVVAATAAHRLQVAVMFARRLQGFDLTPRRDHGLVRAIEFGEIADQSFGSVEGLRRVEHEVAQEDVQVSEVLRGLRLVQQPQRHLVVDAEQMAEAFGVAGERIEVMDVGQLLLELAQIQVETAEVLGDVERALGDHVVLAHVTCGGAAASDPQQAYQADHTAITGAVLQHQRGPGGALAQVLGGDFAGATVLLVGPCAAHVGHQVAVAATALGFTRSGVEVDDGRWRQQCGHGIEQGRFARAGAADEQEATLGDRHFGQAVERAPVVHLQATHAELLQARVRQAVVEQGGSVLGNGHAVLGSLRLQRPGFHAAGGRPPKAGIRLRRRTAASTPARLRGGLPGRRGGSGCGCPSSSAPPRRRGG
ncbi:hypothetical protein D3C72_675250 [compost metagenome]